MENRLASEEIARWHRHFAVDANNQAWDLAAQATRTAEEDQAMLNAAYTAAYHWAEVGTPLNWARADVALAHVHALLGHSRLALEHAWRCLAFFDANPQEGEDWDRAFAYAVLAHAAAAAGDRELHADAYARAAALGHAIADAEDRSIFLDEFARIPPTVI